MNVPRGLARGPRVESCSFASVPDRRLTEIETNPVVHTRLYDGTKHANYSGRSIDLGIASGGGFNGNGGTHLTKLYTTRLNALGAEADGGGPIVSFGDQEYGDPGEIDEIKA